MSQSPTKTPVKKRIIRGKTKRSSIITNLTNTKLYKGDNIDNRLDNFRETKTYECVKKWQDGEPLIYNPGDKNCEVKDTGLNDKDYCQIFNPIFEKIYDIITPLYIENENIPDSNYMKVFNPDVSTTIITKKELKELNKLKELNELTDIQNKELKELKRRINPLSSLVHLLVIPNPEKRRYNGLSLHAEDINDVNNMFSIGLRKAEEQRNEILEKINEYYLKYKKNKPKKLKSIKEWLETSSDGKLKSKSTWEESFNEIKNTTLDGMDLADGKIFSSLNEDGTINKFKPPDWVVGFHLHPDHSVGYLHLHVVDNLLRTKGNESKKNIAKIAPWESLRRKLLSNSKFVKFNLEGILTNEEWENISLCEKRTRYFYSEVKDGEYISSQNTFTIMITDMKGSTSKWKDNPRHMHFNIIKHNFYLRYLTDLIACQQLNSKDEGVEFVKINEIGDSWEMVINDNKKGKGKRHMAVFWLISAMLQAYCHQEENLYNETIDIPRIRIGVADQIPNEQLNVTYRDNNYIKKNIKNKIINEIQTYKLAKELEGGASSNIEDYKFKEEDDLYSDVGMTKNFIDSLIGEINDIPSSSNFGAIKINHFLNAKLTSTISKKCGEYFDLPIKDVIKKLNETWNDIKGKILKTVDTNYNIGTQHIYEEGYIVFLRTSSYYILNKILTSLEIVPISIENDYTIANFFIKEKDELKIIYKNCKNEQCSLSIVNVKEMKENDYSIYNIVNKPITCSNFNNEWNIKQSEEYITHQTFERYISHAQNFAARMVFRLPFQKKEEKVYIYTNERKIIVDFGIAKVNKIKIKEDNIPKCDIPFCTGLKDIKQGLIRKTISDTKFHPLKGLKNNLIIYTNIEKSEIDEKLKEIIEEQMNDAIDYILSYNEEDNIYKDKIITDI